MRKLLIIAAFCLSVKVFAIEKLNVSELLDRYAANQNKLNSLIVKTEERFVIKWSHEPSPDFVRWITEYRTDGKRIHLKLCIWDDLVAEDAPAPIADAQHFVEVWNGKFYIECYDVPTKIPKEYITRVCVSTEEKHRKSTYLTYIGVPFLGIRYGDYERIDYVFRKADSVSVQDKPEQVGSVACYVIDAKTKSRDYTVWIDPEHGYNIAKADIKVKAGDLFCGRQFKDGESESLSIINIRFEKKDDAWVPMEADLYGTNKRIDRPSVRSALHHKITQIILYPNKEMLGSFIPNIENGTEVRNKDSGVNYVWENKKKFVVDEWDNSIKYVLKDWSIQVGAGKPLPKFEGIELNLSDDEMKEKAILLCFFDMDQRPSRNCLQQLNIRTRELKAKGIVVIAIQSSKVSEKKLNEWIRNYNISLMVGMVQGNEEKTKFVWGVRSLPWLILTDKRHVVCREGFTIAELDEIISNNSKLE